MKRSLETWGPCGSPPLPNRSDQRIGQDSLVLRDKTQPISTRSGADQLVPGVFRVGFWKRRTQVRDLRRDLQHLHSSVVQYGTNGVFYGSGTPKAVPSEQERQFPKSDRRNRTAAIVLRLANLPDQRPETIALGQWTIHTKTCVSRRITAAPPNPPMALRETRCL